MTSARARRWRCLCVGSTLWPLLGALSGVAYVPSWVWMLPFGALAGAYALLAVFRLSRRLRNSPS
jgi:hypothetical protein